MDGVTIVSIHNKVPYEHISLTVMGIHFCDDDAMDIPWVTGGFLAKGQIMWDFVIFFDGSLSTLLSKQPSCHWFGTPRRSYGVITLASLYNIWYPAIYMPHARESIDNYTPNYM